ncbi:MAG: RNA polymerase sigma factor SigI [Streptosporangiaceae bacterium]|nr:RNA polymerase sigma factor SigI [Streptosporangiaceae bacterium]MBV9853530.1 RNA polymerase sigma factor SigI [Streptosporangiaceae bacterium]
MDGTRSGEQVIRAWNLHRPYLVDLAFRMLGDIAAAEDVVQDAFARLMREDLGEIEDERGWLIVVTSRLCLDQIRSARFRRERPHDSATIEAAPAPSVMGGGRAADPADPADRVTLDDGVRLALLVVLQRLTPAERVVFVLHDIFQVPFEEVSETVGKSAPACRQLARRARQKVADGSAAGSLDVAAAEHRKVTERFIAACATGDLRGLTAVLAPDVWGYVDLGAESARRPPAVTGSATVARILLHYWRGATFASLPVSGQPAVLAFTGRRLDGVIVLAVDGELITSVQVIGDPRKIGFLRSQLAAG